ncbi:hypothetical protein, partial [Bacillus mycoides]|uniref:hypothetical protein n=1 Tax=Bacillus mycoides TaxID=1405 RepID=UPI001C930114
GGDLGCVLGYNRDSDLDMEVLLLVVVLGVWKGLVFDIMCFVMKWRIVIFVENVVISFEILFVGHLIMKLCR